MPFKHLPLLERMESFYQLPRDRQRFDTYLDMLIGPDREDIVLPIASFNPMGKDLVLEKIKELRAVEAEHLIQAAVEHVNINWAALTNDVYTVALNLVDDIGGAWSNKYTTDYTSKFDHGGMVKRHFCLPVFFTSEKYDANLVHQRALEYLYRTIHWLHLGKPETLQQHLDQEIFVQRHVNSSKGTTFDSEELQAMERLLIQHGPENSDYNTIFNFLYGDPACEPLNYPCFGVPEMAGFRYAACLAEG